MKRKLSTDAGSGTTPATNASTAELNAKLLAAAENGLLEDVQSLLNGGAEAFFQEETTGRSVIMPAASEGHVEVVKELLKQGAPWNALDREGRCAGEYAIANSQQRVVDMLVNAGVQAELLLGSLLRKDTKVGSEGCRGIGAGVVEGKEKEKGYLEQKVEYTLDGEKLLDEDGEAVMMEWEKSLMDIHARVVCQRDHVLNVGFGMGIIDTAIQALKPKSHTIIEAHPEVFARMKRQGWDKKPGVTILFGRWQDVLAEGCGLEFDGIFFDTYGEYYQDLREFHQLLPRILRPKGIYTFFNGLCPRNIFFHAVCCQLVQLELEKLGFEVQFEGVEVDRKALSADTWKDVKNRYWFNDTYYLPVALLKGASS